MNQLIFDQLVEYFIDKFDVKPDMGVRAPGRINLIGEHTDYNMGFVMPGAIDKCIYIVGRKNGLDRHRWYAYDMDEMVEVPINQREKTDNEWADFILGGLVKLAEDGAGIEGLDIAFNSDLPIGAGLSSSSALSCGMIYLASELFGLQNSNKEVAMIGHRSEREFVGLKGGIMDQFASSLGQKDHILLLDCRSRELNPMAIPESDYELLLINTCVKHSLVSTDYNVRALETAEAAKILGKKYDGVSSLRDANLGMLETLSEELGPTRKKRTEYVLAENQRVIDTVKALAAGDIEKVGALLFESHRGLSEKYEVSCAELDFLAEFAESYDGVIGARMMGGGFGGCTINLVHKDYIEAFKLDVHQAYKIEFNITPAFIPVKLTDGLSKISIEK